MVKAKALDPHIDPREASRSTIDKLGGLWSLRRDDLLRVQMLAGFGSDWGVIDVPREMLPPGSAQKLSRRRIDLRDLPGVSDIAICAVMRLWLFRFLYPIGNTSRPCSMSTLARTALNLKRIAARALSKPARSDRKFWARLTISEIYEIYPRTQHNDIGQLFRTAKTVGRCPDTPDLADPLRVVGPLAEPLRKGDEPKNVMSLKQPFQYLPDEFVSECGWRSSWVINVMGPVILTALEHVYASCRFRRDIGFNTALDQLRENVRKELETYPWPVEGFGNEAPFDLALSTQRNRSRGSASEPFVWPPKTLPDLWQCASVVQGAHAFVVGLSGGPREGEILSLRQTALVPSEGGWRIQGRTFKLVYKEAGRLRDWPAPEFTVRAVEQQVRLTKLTQRVANCYGLGARDDQLWVLLPVGGHQLTGLPLDSLSNALSKLASALGIKHLLSGPSSRERNFHPHRLRETTARILGLAINNSLGLLMDLFGHRDPEMTMKYLLSNKELCEEARDIARKEAILTASSAITNADRCGGKAAKKIREVATQFSRRRGMDRLDAQSATELAEHLTLNGDFWELVRPGVICTKLPSEVGACTRRSGSPDPSLCSSSCDHRLELEAFRRDVDETLTEAVSNYRAAKREGNVLMAAMWAKQIRENLPRFEDLAVKWMMEPDIAELAGHKHEA